MMMADKPMTETDIPADIMDAARESCRPGKSGAVRVDDAQHVIDVALAILAERERARTTPAPAHGDPGDA
jgi:hypothetical protein